jgi:tetratricopeptide repeat protein 8
MTTMGREVRLGTASMVSNNGQFVDIPKFMAGSKKNIEKFKIALTEYSLHVEHNVKQALEICAEGTKAQNFENWWWKARLGKCYYKLGLLREAEQQFKSSLRNQPIINTYLELCNVYLRLDLPSTALAILAEGAEKFNREPRLLLGIARIHDMLNNPEEANTYYNMVLGLDAGNVEATACLGAHNFYSDRPEVAIRYYRRLLQIGVNSAEVWNNIGLSCFYSSQYDMALNCMERALAIASDDTAADIWYNIGHIAIAIGDLILALQAFKVASAIDPNHGEALNNIAVLEMRKQKLDQKYDYAKSILSNSISVGTHLFEPQYNSALLCFRQGNLQEAFNFVEQALKIYPNHADSKELHDILKKTFSSA